MFRSGIQCIAEAAVLYRITRMFCEHQTFANFAMVNQFPTIKSAKSKLLLVNTHDPCQNAIVRLQRVNFLLIWLIRKGFSPAKYSSNTVAAGSRLVHCMGLYLYIHKITELEPVFKVPCILLNSFTSSQETMLLYACAQNVDCCWSILGGWTVAYSVISGLPLEKRCMSWGSTVYSLHCTIKLYAHCEDFLRTPPPPHPQSIIMVYTFKSHQDMTHDFNTLKWAVIGLIMHFSVFVIHMWNTHTTVRQSNFPCHFYWAETHKYTHNFVPIRLFNMATLYNNLGGSKWITKLMVSCSACINYGCTLNHFTLYFFLMSTSCACMHGSNMCFSLFSALIVVAILSQFTCTSF